MSAIINVIFRHTIDKARFNSFRFIDKSFFTFRKLTPRDSDIKQFKYISIQCAKLCRPAYDVNTNVIKDTILFKYDNPKFFNILNIFAISQLLFWTYLAHFAFTTLKDAPVVTDPNAELKWYQKINLGENKYRNTIAASSFLIGYGILVASWLFTLHSVRFLILRQGGQTLSIVTYGPFNKNRILDVPLKFVSAYESREAAKTQLPLKVKGRSLFYILDKRGEFKNPQLFDQTAGLKRRL